VYLDGTANADAHMLPYKFAARQEELRKACQRTLWNEDPIVKVPDESMDMIMIHYAVKVDQLPANLMRYLFSALIRVVRGNSCAKVSLPANALPTKIPSQ
jgi:hypothetical protein